MTMWTILALGSALTALVLAVFVGVVLLKAVNKARPENIRFNVTIGVPLPRLPVDRQRQARSD